ncbi:hypothetical protein ACFL1K_05830, partial [Candidatus Omnitrophota bacterium]
MKRKSFILVIILAAVAALLSLLLNTVFKAKPIVFIEKYKNGDYELFVKGKPYIVKGVCYNPVPIGSGHDY